MMSNYEKLLEEAKAWMDKGNASLGDVLIDRLCYDVRELIKWKDAELHSPAYEKLYRENAELRANLEAWHQHGININLEWKKTLDERNELVEKLKRFIAPIEVGGGVLATVQAENAELRAQNSELLKWKDAELHSPAYQQLYREKSELEQQNAELRVQLKERK